MNVDNVGSSDTLTPTIFTKMSGTYLNVMNSILVYIFSVKTVTQGLSLVWFVIYYTEAKFIKCIFWSILFYMIYKLLQSDKLLHKSKVYSV